MGTSEANSSKLRRLQAALDQGLITAEEYDRAAESMGLKKVVKTRTQKIKHVGSVVGLVGLVLGAASDAASVFYPALSGPIGSVVKIVDLIGSWF